MDRFLSAPLLLLAACVARADGPGDNLPDKVRPVPPPGITLPASAREELQKGSDALGGEIELAHKALEKKPELLTLLPDVQVFHNAVRYALKYNEFYQPREVETA